MRFQPEAVIPLESHRCGLNLAMRVCVCMRVFRMRRDIAAGDLTRVVSTMRAITLRGDLLGRLFI